MSDTDPLAPVLGASDPKHRPQRTLAGALATFALLWVMLLAFVAPVLTAAGVATVAAPVLLVGAARRVRRRQRPRKRVRLCLPGTSRCVSL